MKPFDLQPPFPARLSDLTESFADESGAGNTASADPSETSGYAIIEASGADAAVFLNGQLTTDMVKLAEGQCQTSALCNLKGRVIAQFDVARLSDERFALFMRRSLTPGVLSTLSRYVLRSKVRLALWPDNDAATVHLTDRPLAPGETVCDGEQIRCRPTWLPQGEPDWVMSNQPDREQSNDASLSFAHLHVLTGIAPPVDGTELEYIPQMLNLDRLNGVSVTKGCYTGQEIISRVHHRGSVKRRLRRFVSVGNDRLQIGDPIEDRNGTDAGQVVEVVQDTQGRSALLAVIKESAFGSGDIDTPAHLTCRGLALLHWPLPYEV